MTEKTAPQSNFLSTIKVGGWTFISRVAGLIRDIFTTNLLGASFFHDIFVVVLKIPNVFRKLFAEGAFSQAFIPIYSEYIGRKDDKDSQDFLNALFGILLSALFIFTALALLFAPIFILIFAPGFYFDIQKQDLAVSLLRIMFPYLALISLVAFAAGIQNSHNKFSIPAITPLIFNLSLIGSAWLVAPKIDIPVMALAWGVLLAGFLQLLFQIAPLATIKKIPIPKIDFQNPGVKKFFILILPAIVAGGIAQINLLIDTIFASLLITGSPTWLYVSDRLIQFPMGIFAIAIGTVLLPSLSKAYAQKEIQAYTEQLEHAFKLVFFLAIPSLIGLVLFASPLLATIFQRGAFLWSDVQQASLSLIAFSFGLPFFMAMKVLVPAFFSRQNTKTPMLIAFLSLLINVCLNYLLAFYFGLGHLGLAIASSISAIVSVIILSFILKRDGLISFTGILSTFSLKVLIASVALISFLSIFNQYFDFELFSQTQRLLHLVAAVIGSLIIYFGSSFILGVRPADFK
ncbi:murein biosynthesis integral membrane protein MurJ [Gammaproteobacteria bacterium]|nr:murein biosynthesis integral membrane protein MurJ [Gammaproteobacteria bacterium]MDC1146807.1 murein biosynthesis integral membrane protein MurJ [Gammaproteobacteria bacterium]